MSVPSWARVGAKVVFTLDIKPPDMRGVHEFPRLNQIYTIREIVIHRGHAYLLLREIVNPVVMTSDGVMAERAAAIECFRPLISQSDDLAAHFNQHLSRSAPVKMEEEA